MAKSQAKFEIKTTLSFQRSPRGMGKAFAGAKQHALKDVGEYWHDNYLPDKFKSGAGRRYGLQSRSRKHNKRKRRKFGHNKPLVFTGTLMRALRGMAQIHSFKNSVRVKMSAPKYVYYRRGDGPDMPAEIQKIRPDEGQKLAQVAADRMAEAMNKAKGKG